MVMSREVFSCVFCAKIPSYTARNCVLYSFCASRSVLLFSACRFWHGVNSNYQPSVSWHWLHPGKTGQIAQDAEQEQNDGHAGQDPGLKPRQPAVSGLYIAHGCLNGNCQSGRQQQKDGGIGPEGRYKVQAKERQAHAAYTASGTI